MESTVQQVLYNVHVNHLCIISWSVVSTNIALSGPVTRHSQTRRRSHESSSSDKAEGICLPWHIYWRQFVVERFFLNMDVVTVFMINGMKTIVCRPYKILWRHFWRLCRGSKKSYVWLLTLERHSWLFLLWKIYLSFPPESARPAYLKINQDPLT